MPTPSHIPASLAAQAPQGTTSMADVILPITFMVMALIVLGVVLLWFRKHLLTDGSVESGGGLTLHELRSMRDQGIIDDDEYERMRAALIPTTSEVHPEVAALRAGRSSENSDENEEDGTKPDRAPRD